MTTADRANEILDACVHGIYVDAGPDGLPPHKPDDTIERAGTQPRTCHDVARPRYPSREVDVWDECGCCGEWTWRGTRELDDAEFADAVAQYEKDLAEWERTGGAFVEVTGPVDHHCTITSADGSLVVEYSGNGEVWRVVNVETRYCTR